MRLCSAGVLAQADRARNPGVDAIDYAPWMARKCDKSTFRLAFFDCRRRVGIRD